MKSITFLFFLMLMMTETFFAQTPPIEPGVSQTLAKWRAANYSDVRYKLNITLEKGAPLMRGEIEIRVNLTDEGAKSPLVLDWRTTQFTNDKDKPFANVVGINDAMDFRSQENKEHIVIPNGYLKTGENVIKIQFASPIKTSGAGLTRYVDKEDSAEYVYSLFVPSDASTAFPVFDQPDLKAKFILSLQTESNWKAISNTKIFSRSNEDCRQGSFCGTTHNFEETKPISTYVFAFAAGDFAEMSEPSAVADGLTRQSENSNKNSNASNAKLQPPTTADGSDLPMKIYIRKSQAEKFKAHSLEVFRLNREGIKFLESYFDYKFPFPKYDLVLIPEFPFGGMEHAGATFLREASVIFPTEPTKNDYVSRANVIFHEAAHQWFGDTVTMKWFDDLWLKEGFAEFMAYKTLSKVMPEYNAWKIFYERNKQAAYLTDSTKGTTPIYQEIANLSAAKSAYGNIVYRKAPSFLKQAEFYLGEDKFQIAVRAFLKKHEFKNAEWTDLVKEFETASKQDLKDWANVWVKQRGLPIIKTKACDVRSMKCNAMDGYAVLYELNQTGSIVENDYWQMSVNVLITDFKGKRSISKLKIGDYDEYSKSKNTTSFTAYQDFNPPQFVFPNYQDYGYGIFLLDAKSRDYVLQNIQTEKDDFLRTMMWGALWDSVREGELDPKDYVELVIKNFARSPALRRKDAETNSSKNESRNVSEEPSKDGTTNIGESDESTIQMLLGRVSTAMNYYLSEPPAVAGGSSDLGMQNADFGLNSAQKTNPQSKIQNPKSKNPSATADGSDLNSRLESLLIERIANAKTPGQRITFYRAFLNLASSAKAAQILKDILAGKSKVAVFQLKTKDKFDIVTRLLIMGDKDAPNLLANLEKTETSDEAKRYAYAARAGIGTAENKAKYFKDFVKNKDISESWIEAALNPFNSPKHSALTLQYLETALAELPNLKKNRKIFFVNGWLGAFIGGQRSEEALAIVNKFLADNPNLDRDLRLKILENADGIERAVKIRAKYGK